MNFLKEKPTSMMSIQTEASYEDIKGALYLPNIPHKTLDTMVKTCKQKPHSVVFVIYKSFENSILLVFGEKPHCYQMEGSALQHIMRKHSKEGVVYLFTYVKEQ